MLSGEGNIIYPEVWQAWLKQAESKHVPFRMHIGTNYDKAVPEYLQQYVTSVPTDDSWCNSRGAVFSLLRRALADSDVSYVVIVSDNSMPMKSLRFIQAELSRDSSSRMCQDRAWSIPRAETWWSMSRTDAEFFLNHMDLVQNAIDQGLGNDGRGGKSCLDENTWLPVLLLRNKQWGMRSPLRDECFMYTDWSGSCKHWNNVADSYSTPKLMQTLPQPHPTGDTRPMTYENVSLEGFEELVRSPFWFARKFTSDSFRRFDPLFVLSQHWERESNDAYVSSPSRGRSLDSCNTSTLQQMQRRGPGMIISGPSASDTQAVANMVELTRTHDFGKGETLGRSQPQSLQTSPLIEAAHRQFRSAPTLFYEVEDVKTNEERVGLLSSACNSLMSLEDASLHERPWAMEGPSLRFLLPAYDSVIGMNYRFLHVVRDVRYANDTSDEYKLASALMHRGLSDLDRALEEAVATDSILLQRWPRESIQRWVSFAYLWGHVELSLHKIFKQRRSEQYFLLTDVGLRSLQKPEGRLRAEELATFLAGSTDGPDVEALIEHAVELDQPVARDDHFEMMDAIMRLPSLTVTRSAMKTFGFE